MRRLRALPRAVPALPAPSSLLFPPLPPGPPTTRVVVLTGFLGAGKTTTLARLLDAAAAAGAKVRAVVNDVGASNIDAATLRGMGVPGAAGAPDFVLALTAGCVCCTLQHELTAAIADAAADPAVDWVFVECTGLASPGPVAAAVAVAGEGAALAAVVVVVDASTLAAGLAGELDGDGRDDGSDGAPDPGAVADLLADQVEGADVVLLNKADVATPDDMAAAAALVAALNPGADILACARGAVPPAALASPPGGARGVAGWVAALDAAAAERAAAAPQRVHVHVAGVSHNGLAARGAAAAPPPSFSTFAFHADRPFHPARLLAALEGDATWAGVLRSKGFFWLATRPAVAGAWQAAGGAWAGDPSHPWAGGESAPCQDLVFIGGQGMDRARVVAALDAALLSDGELAAGPAAWAAYDDPLPEWEVEEEEEEDV
jgi:G3E family GTPase